MKRRKREKKQGNMSMHLTRKTKLMQAILLRGKKIDERGMNTENSNPAKNMDRRVQINGWKNSIA
jgi:hypothetical protein